MPASCATVMASWSTRPAFSGSTHYNNNSIKPFNQLYKPPLIFLITTPLYIQTATTHYTPTEPSFGEGVCSQYCNIPLTTHSHTPKHLSISLSTPILLIIDLTFMDAPSANVRICRFSIHTTQHPLLHSSSILYNSHIFEPYLLSLHFYPLSISYNTPFFPLNQSLPTITAEYTDTIFSLHADTYYASIHTCLNYTRIYNFVYHNICDAHHYTQMSNYNISTSK
jgi:hypothetical protein